MKIEQLNNLALQKIINVQINKYMIKTRISMINYI